jgi:ABC-type branched-subunit amino acid transport system substrate-binding protein
MRNRGLATTAAACAFALVLAGCGSDDEAEGGSGGGSTEGGGGGTVRVGVLTSLSGPAGTTYAGSPDAVQARLTAYEEQGGECADAVDFEVVEGDDASSPQGALAAAQKLVQQDDVFGIVTVSSFFYGVSQFLSTQAPDVAVAGVPFDGSPDWNTTDDNLFNAGPVPDYDTVFTTGGEYMASQGGTVVAGLAFASPSAQQGLEVALQSSEAAGLERGYVNDSIPFGSTDVGAIVLGIIDSGADVLTVAITPDTAFAVIAGLKQANYELKAIVLPAGYGNDLLQSAPAVQLGQGTSFQVGFTPIEQGGEGADLLSQTLIDEGLSDSGIPGFAQSSSWLATDLLLHGLEEAGCDASQADVVAALQEDSDWDAGGLYPNPVDQTDPSYDEQCLFYVKLDGEAFVPVDDAAPLCGGPVDS